MIKHRVKWFNDYQTSNWIFSSGDDATALDCYNQSIILAPFDTQSMTGEDLSIAAANRAAVFLRQEKFT